MDERRIMLVKLSQGAIGEENAHLLGALLMAKFQQVAQSRQDSSQRPQFFLYLDEFQHFVTPSMAAILSGARKYGLSMVLAHQDLSQLGRRETGVLGAAISNPAVRICFRVGDSDAKKLAEGFEHFSASDLLSLGVGEAICRIDQARHDFNLRTERLEPVDSQAAAARKNQIQGLSRERYSLPREEVAQLLESRHSVAHDTATRRTATPAAVPRDDAATPASAPKAASKDLSGEEQQAKMSEPKRRPPTPPEQPGRGGRQHRHLQQLLKAWAEAQGF